MRNVTYKHNVQMCRKTISYEARIQEAPNHEAYRIMKSGESHPTDCNQREKSVVSSVSLLPVLKRRCHMPPMHAQPVRNPPSVRLL